MHHIEAKREMLKEVEKLVCGDRARVYGSPLENFQRFCELASPIVELTPLEAIMLMICVKLSRLIESPTHEDSWKDIAGYAACAYAIIKEEEEEEEGEEEEDNENEEEEEEENPNAVFQLPLFEMPVRS